MMLTHVSIRAVMPSLEPFKGLPGPRLQPPLLFAWIGHIHQFVFGPAWLSARTGPATRSQYADICEPTWRSPFTLALTRADWPKGIRTPRVPVARSFLSRHFEVCKIRIRNHIVPVVMWPWLINQ